MIDEVHILVDSKRQFPSVTHAAAWEGFTQRGKHVELRTHEELVSQEPRPEVLVFGGVFPVLSHLQALGCAPEPLDYPGCLDSFLHRKISQTTMKMIRQRFSAGRNIFNQGPEPLFIKPKAQKLFTGHVVANFRDLLRTVRIVDEEPLFISPVMRFLSEWRCYVYKGEVVGIGHYKGDPLSFPSSWTLRRMIQDFTPHAPVAYGLDVGQILPEPRSQEAWTALVEVNDMFALGCYGLSPLLFSKMIEDRWCELVYGQTKDPPQLQTPRSHPETCILDGPSGSSNKP